MNYILDVFRNKKRPKKFKIVCLLFKKSFSHDKEWFETLSECSQNVVWDYI